MFLGDVMQLLCIHNVYMETFVLRGLILCESEVVLSELLCIHNVGMGPSWTDFMCL